MHGNINSGAAGKKIDAENVKNKICEPTQYYDKYNKSNNTVVELHKNYPSTKQAL